MPPRKSTGRATKRNSGLAQPTLSFSQRKPSVQSLSKQSSKAISPTSSIEVDLTPTREDAPALAPAAVDEVYIKDGPKEVERKKELGLKKTSTSTAEGTPLKKQQVNAVRKELDVKSKEWDGVYRDAKAAMGGLPPIHAGPDTHNNVHHILRVFDLTSKYGPCVGVTRLQRWERAKKWGLNPPDEIHSILTTKQGEDEPAYRENVLYGWV